MMREIIAWAREEYKTKACVAVTAPTGIAAKNVGGRSIHSWAGIGLGKEDAPTLAKQIAGTPTTAKRWTDVKMLIIDESKDVLPYFKSAISNSHFPVSMVNGVLFDKLVRLVQTHYPRNLSLKDWNRSTLRGMFARTTRRLVASRLVNCVKSNVHRVA